MKQLALAIVFMLSACTQPVQTITLSPIPTQAVVPSPTGTTDLFAQNNLNLGSPSCDGNLTPAQTEGPYYKAATPEQNILFTSGMPGKKLIVAGYVLDQNCRPISNAWLDFWQADANGSYDNTGFTLRGHQYTDPQGRYFLETVFPGEYPGRTQHIHVKIQPPGGNILTSQLYFPNEPGNATDGIFDPALIVKLEDRGDYSVAHFNFVVQK